MLPEVFGVPTFGILSALATLVTFLLATRMAKREGLHPEVVIDGTLVIIILGVIGCRGLHVAENWGYFRTQPWYEVLRLDKGGLSWYGCFVTVMPAAWLYARHKRMRFAALCDLFIFFTVMAQAAGRLGCFLYGCCWGHQVEPGAALSSIAMRFPVGSPAWQSHVHATPGFERVTSLSELKALLADLPPGLRDGSYAVLPTQLGLSFGAIAIALFFAWYYGRHRRHGQVFAACFTLLALNRFTFEFFRADSLRFGPLTDAQWYSLVAMAVGAGLFARAAKRGAPYRKGDFGGASAEPALAAASSAVEREPAGVLG